MDILYIFDYKFNQLMKNIIILSGIILYSVSIFLPWGPEGSNLATGFNEEASPGIIAILAVIICFIFGIKSSKKAYLITMIVGVLMLLFPLTIFSRVFELSGNDYLAIKYGVYLMISGSILIIYGAYKNRKKSSYSDEIA